MPPPGESLGADQAAVSRGVELGLEQNLDLAGGDRLDELVGKGRVLLLPAVRPNPSIICDTRFCHIRDLTDLTLQISVRVGRVAIRDGAP